MERNNIHSKTIGIAVIRYRYTLIARPNMVVNGEQVAKEQDRQWIRDEAILFGNQPFPKCQRCGVASQVIYCQKLDSIEYGFHCVNCKREVKP